MKNTFIFTSIITIFALSITGCQTRHTQIAKNQKLFEISDATKKKIKADPAYKILLKRANTYLNVKPINPKGKYGSNKGPQAKRNVHFWPRVVGIPLIKWMHNLGFAYKLTGDKKYADKGIELLTQTCKDFPVTHENIRKGIAGARAHIIYGLALGCNLFGDLMTKEQLKLVENTAAGYVDDCIKVFGNKNASYYLTANHTTLSGAPAGMVCLYFINQPGFKERLKKVTFLLEGWLNHTFDEKGLYIEGYGYARYGMTPRLMIFAWQLRNYNGKDLFQNPKLKQLPYALVEKLIPGTQLFDTRGDNDYTSAGLECLFLAVANHDSAAMWLWEHSDKVFRTFPVDIILESYGAPKAEIDFSNYPKSEFFPVREFALWRTGWGKNDVLFSFEAGPYGRAPNGKGGTHAQSDKGHFCLYGFGEMWAMDSGYANDAANPLSRSHSFAHNLVLIDGKGQLRPRVDAKTERYFDSKDYGFIRADLTSAYNINDRKQKRTPAVKRVERQALFIRPSNNIPAYAAVLDDTYVDAKDHIFSWMMMVPPDKSIKLRQNGALISAMNAPSAFVTTPLDKPAGTVSWKVKITKAGKYSFWLRCAAGGISLPHSNSCWFSIDGKKDIRWDFLSNTRNFTWLRLSRSSDAKSLSPVALVAVEFPLTVGEHTITLKTREKEAHLAEVYYTNDNSSPFSPSENGTFLNVANAQITGGMKLIQKDISPNNSSCIVAINAANAVSLSKDTYYPPNPRPPLYFQRLQADTTAVNPYFVAILIPLKDKTQEPKIHIDRKADCITITVDWKNAKDTITWPINKDGSTKDATFKRVIKQ